MRKELEKDLENEEFRLEIVFFTGNPDLLFDRNYKTSLEPSRNWLLTARRFLQLYRKYKIATQELAQNLFNWVSNIKVTGPEVAKFDAAPPLEQELAKTSLDGYIAQVKRLGLILGEEDRFYSMSFTFLLLMLEYNPDAIKVIIDKITNEEKDKFLENPLGTFKTHLK